MHRTKTSASRSTPSAARPTVAVALHLVVVSVLALAGWDMLARSFDVPPYEMVLRVDAPEVRPVRTRFYQTQDMATVFPTEGMPTENANARATWSDIVRSEGCWFFSGPAPLGRDVRYGESARVVVDGALHVQFGSRVFTGSETDGRVSAVVHGRGRDGTWATEETLVGTRADDGTLDLTYRSLECEDRGEGCKVGVGSGNTCSISAKVRIEVAPPPRDDGAHEIVCGH